MDQMISSTTRKLTNRGCGSVKNKIFMAGAAVVTIAVLVIGAVFAWHGIWHLRRANVGKQYGVNQGTQQYQSSLISQERDRVQAYDLAIDPGQRTQISLTFCQVYPELTRPTPDLTAAGGRLCSQDLR